VSATNESALERLLDGARLLPGDDVVALGAGAPELAFAAHARVGDGWVHAVDREVARLEALLREAHARGAAGISYLVGDAEVLPLPDGSADAAIAFLPLHASGDGTTAAQELLRVLRPGGRLSLAGPDETLAAALRAAGFAAVEADSARLTATRP
jgi:ubiquinone/menaquinone biosynthesis C-methylase UbiE